MISENLSFGKTEVCIRQLWKQSYPTYIHSLRCGQSFWNPKSLVEVLLFIVRVAAIQFVRGCDEWRNFHRQITWKPGNIKLSCWYFHFFFHKICAGYECLEQVAFNQPPHAGNANWNNIPEQVSETGMFSTLTPCMLQSSIQRHQTGNSSANPASFQNGSPT